MLKSIVIFLSYLVLITPLIVSDRLFFPFITGKAFYFRIIVEVLFSLYLVLAISNREYRPKKSFVLLAFSLCVGSILISNILAPNSFKAFWSNFERMEGFVTIAHVFTYFLILGSVFKNSVDWNRLFAVSIGVSTFMSFYAILQIVGELNINQGGARVDGTLGNSAYFAGYMLVSIFLTLFIWLNQRGSLKIISNIIIIPSFVYILFYLSHIAPAEVDAGFKGKIILLSAFILCAYSIYLKFIKSEKIKKISSNILFLILVLVKLFLIYESATRGAILGLIGGLVFSALLIIFFDKKEDKTIRRISYSVLISIVLLIGTFFSFKNTDYVTNHPILSRFASISWGDTKTQARAFIWPMAIEGFKEKPIFGWGQEGFNYVFQKYYNPELITHEPWFDRTHNTFLEWLVTGGILGFIFYISIFVFSLYYLFKKIKEEEYSVESAVFIGLILGYLFQNIFIFDQLVSYIYFAVIIAFVHSNYTSSSKKVCENLPESKSNLVIFSVSVIGLIAIVSLNRAPFMQNITLIKALQERGGVDKNLELFDNALSYDHLGNSEIREHLLRFSYNIFSSPNIPADFKQNLGQKMINEFNKQIEDAPLEARTQVIIGSFLNDLGASQLALPYLNNALTLSPKKQHILYQVGIAEMTLGQIEKGLDHLKYAYDLLPSFNESSVLYSIGLLNSGNFSESFALAKNLSDQGFVDERYVRALVSKKRFNDALNILENAININNKLENNYFLMASVYSSLGNKVKAKDVISKLLLVNPESKNNAKAYLEKIEKKLN